MPIFAKICLLALFGLAPMPPQNTQKYLRQLVGQRLILRHYASSANHQVKEKDLNTARGGCDAAVEVMAVTFEKTAILLRLRNVGVPIFGSKIGRKGTGCAGDIYIVLKITHFDMEQPPDQTEKAIGYVLQTPESYLAALGITWEVPRSSENELPVDVSRPGVTAPKLVLLINPAYTEADRKAHTTGTVTINCVIGTDGLVHGAVIAKGLTEGLNENAIDALTLSRFQPGRDGDHVVAVKVPVQFSFKLF